MLKIIVNSIRLFIKSPKISSLTNVIQGHLIIKSDKVLVQKSKLAGNVELQEGVKISECFFSGNINIGRYTSISGPNTSVISSSIGKVTIGSFCSIARGVQIQEFNHNFMRTSSYFFSKNIFQTGVEKDIFTKGDIIIEDDVWLGTNAVILSGVTIGRGSIISAGTIVNKDVPAYSILGGVPGKLIKKRFGDQTIELLENSKWWMWDIGKIKSNPSFFLSNRF